MLLNMPNRFFCLEITTECFHDFIDITDWVKQCVESANISEGIAIVFSKHTTTAITINENEPLLIQDMKDFLDRCCPKDSDYGHNNFDIRTVNMNEDESPNAHSHLQHMLLGSSEVIPIVDKKLLFGQYQSVFCIELDRPRRREVVVQILGD
tara:strand:- start:837 stop:1292 length:456 start_codon:yes stop_codon:yes gene_type:complete